VSLLFDIDNCTADNKTTCDLLLPAVGLQYECEAGEKDFSAYDEATYLADDAVPQKNKTVFGVSFDWPHISDYK
jgi:hypothetical protein